MQIVFTLIDDFIALGPAESLFRQPFYELIDEALRQDGILCCQGEQKRLLNVNLTTNASKEG